MARFDPFVDPDGVVNTDATKLAYGNKKGTTPDQKTTEKLAYDFPEIISSSKYVGNTDEYGKWTYSHQGVLAWHYLGKHIGFISAKQEYADYNVSIDVKEKTDGYYVYSFAAKKQGLLHNTNLRISPCFMIRICSPSRYTVQAAFQLV